MMIRALVLGSVLASGCGGAAHSPAAPTGPVADIRCYRGMVSIHAGPDDAEVGRLPAVIRRTVDAGAGTIVEEVSQPGDDGVKTYLVTMAVAGSDFKMTEKSGAFSGQGSLKGADWKWDAWTSQSTLDDGTIVTSTDQRTVDGLSAVKSIVQGGQTVATMHEDYQSLACDQYDAALAELSAPPAASK
jgi:hypothetical protein